MISRDRIGLAAALALICMSACGGRSAQSDSAPGDGSPGASGADASTPPSGPDASAVGVTSGGTAPLPACSWPASLDPADGATGQCGAARMYLACKGSNGGGEECLSNDPAQCPGPNPIVGTTFSACTDQCDAGEYAVACGGPGLGPWPTPPAGCRALPSGPGGGSVACCPCDPGGAPDAASDAVVVTAEDAGIFTCGNSSGACDWRSQICQHVMGGPAPGWTSISAPPFPRHARPMCRAPAFSLPWPGTRRRRARPRGGI